MHQVADSKVGGMATGAKQVARDHLHRAPRRLGQHPNKRQRPQPLDSRGKRRASVRRLLSRRIRLRYLMLLAIFLHWGQLQATNRVPLRLHGGSLRRRLRLRQRQSVQPPSSRAQANLQTNLQTALARQKRQYPLPK